MQFPMLPQMRKFVSMPSANLAAERGSAMRDPAVTPPQKENVLCVFCLDFCSYHLILMNRIFIK